MSFSGGVYTLPGPALVTGEVVSATENNQFRNDVAGALNLTMLRNGTSTATANLPMGGYKLTGLGAPSTNGDSLAYGAAAVVSTLGATGDVTLSGGTANGVAYLNGSKVLTTGSALTFDGTNFGVGTASPAVKFQVNATTEVTAALSVGGTRTLGFYSDGSTLNSINSYQNLPLVFSIASGTSFSEQMRLTSTGLGIGTSSFSTKLAVNGISSFYSATVGAISLGSKTNFTSTFENQAGGYGLGVHVAGSGNVGLQVQSFGSATSYDMVLQPLGGNLGLGVTPSAWSLGKAFETSAGSFFGYSTNEIHITQNTYYNAGWKYTNSSVGSGRYLINAGTHSWFTAPSGTAGNAISFTQAMTLDASGNLGIGTSSPGVKLHVVSDNPLRFGNAAQSGQAQFDFLDSGATLSLYNFYGTGSNLVFKTNPNGGGAVERMRIDSSGNLLVGTTSLLYSNDKVDIVGGRLSVKGSATDTSGVVQTVSNDANISYWYTPNGGGAYVIPGSNGAYIAKNGTSWAAISDERLKTELTPFDNAAEKVATFRAGTGRYLTDEEGVSRSFLIAQDVQKVLPEAVNVQNDAQGTLGLQYTDLIPLLVAAIQELKAELDATKAGVAALKGA